MVCLHLFASFRVFRGSYTKYYDMMIKAMGIRCYGDQIRKEYRELDLVIGYGNTLCSDDAVGRLTAEAVEAWQLPGVQTLSVHQLTPELAADIATAYRVIFIDATVPELAEDCSVSFRSLQPSAFAFASGNMTHHVDPSRLLALSCALYGVKPAAYLLTIPAVDFEVRLDRVGVEVLSETACRGMENALTCLKTAFAQKPEAISI